MFSKLKAILIDLSGTLHIENTPTPGAVEALKRLRSSNIPIKFVTNTTKESRRSLHERLINIGFDISIDEIWSSLWATRSVLTSKKLKPYLLVDDAALEDFEEVSQEEDGEEFNSVVIGLAPEKFNYTELNIAFRLLLSGAPLIAIHEGRYYKRCDGLALGPGPFVKGLEYSAGCKANVVGKPTAEFFKSVLEEVEPKEALMIGDDVRDDIAGAQALGIKGFLVKTGKYREGDEDKIDPHPFRTCNTFEEAVEEIMTLLKQES